MKRSIPLTSQSNLRVFTACLLSFMTLLAPLVPVSAAMKSAPRRDSISTNTRLRPAPTKAESEVKTSGQPSAVAGFLNPLMPAVGPITATKVDSFADSDADGKAELGEQINYTVTITNTGTNDATGLSFSDNIDPNTTLIGSSLNASPLAVDEAYNAIGNTLLEVGVTASGSPAVMVTGSVFDNDHDFLGDTFTLKAVQAVNFAGGNTTATTANGGTVVMEPDGNFSYLPPVDSTATDTFTYTITDDGPDNILGNADDLTGVGTVTINFPVTTKVWWVDNSYGGANGASDGRSTRPYTSLTPLNGADLDDPGDVIYVHNGTYSAGITMEANQQLIGSGVALVVNSITLRNAGTRPTVNTSGDTVSVPEISGVVVRGFNLSSSTANAVDVTTTGANSGGAEIADNVITGAGQEGIDVNGGGSGTMVVSIHDNSVTATGNGIDIARSAGNVTVTAFDDNTILGTTGGIGINVTGGTGSVLFDAVVGGNFDTVSGGNTVVGASGAGNGAGTSGMVLSNIRGDLSFTDLDVYADNGNALSITGSGGTPNFTVNTGTRVTASTNTPTAVATNGAAVNAADANINLVFTTLTSTNSGNTGVSLSRLSGTFSAPASSAINNATGVDFSINGQSHANANINVTYAGTITDDVGTLVQIQNVTSGGTHLFSGAITDGNDGDGSGISLTGNTGATMSFTGGLTLATGANAAFTATGGGTLNVTQNNTTIVNTVTTTTGTGVTITDTNIGASGVTFRSVNTVGAPNGINLSNTGNVGGNLFSITGNGGDCTTGAGTCTGGRIQNSAGGDGLTTGIGIRLNNTRNISLAHMRIDGSQNNGIKGDSVTGITFSDLTLDGTNGNNGGNREGAAAFDNLFGTNTITTSTFTGSLTNDLRVSNTSATALNNLTITASTFSNTNASGIGDDGIQIEGLTGSNMTVTVGGPNVADGNTFNLNEGDHFQATPAGSAIMNITVRNNTMTGDGTAASPTTLLGGITLNSGIDFTGQMTFNVSNNTISGTTAGSGININKGGSGLFSGTLNSNTIGQAGVTLSGCAQNCSGINLISQHKSGDLVVAVTNNTIRNVTLSGIRALIRDTVLAGAGATAANTTMNLTITGNSMSEPNDVSGVSTTERAINVEVVSSTDTGEVCADIGGAGALANTITGAWNLGGTSIRVLTRTSTTSFRLPGYGGSIYDETAAANYIAGRNNEVGGVTADVNPNNTGTGFTGGAACTSPLAQLNFQQQQQTRDELAQSNVMTEPTAKPVASKLTASSNEVFTSHSTSSKKSESVTKLANKRYSSEALFKPFGFTTKARKPQVKRTAAVLAPVAAMPSGENVSVTIGTLPGGTPTGKSIIIKFSVTVDDPYPGPNQYVSNQGTITGTNIGAAVSTDDPAPPAGFPNTASDPTITLVDAIQITVGDVSIAEGAVGDRSMIFTVTLTNPAPAAGVSVNYQTANNTAIAGATPTGDYTTTSGTATVTSGNLTTTFSVPVHGDTVFEGNETFFVNLSTPVNGILLDTQAIGTIADDESQPADFDGDGLADVSIWGADLHWRALLSSTNTLMTPVNWGSPAAPYNDIAVPGDYDGDNKTDVAVWRPSEGNWYILKSSDSSVLTKGWGASGDIPVQGDYDADGKTDLAVFRPSDGNWYVLKSSTDTMQLTNWGGFPGDVPVPADYDGDGKIDVAVFRPSEGNWYIRNSSNGSIVTKAWGISTDSLVPGDYDGDGKADLAVWRGSNGNWYIVSSRDNSTSVKGWGAASLGDVPAPADYDGDGRTDIGVWRPSESNWYILKSSDNTDVLKNLGLTATDKPVPSLYPPQ